MISFQFGNVVVVEGDQIGVIVKSWADNSHDVYVRSFNSIQTYRAMDIRHYVYSKELTVEEAEFYT
jgi:hypothetical protein